MFNEQINIKKIKYTYCCHFSDLCFICSWYFFTCFYWIQKLKWYLDFLQNVQLYFSLKSKNVGNTDICYMALVILDVQTHLTGKHKHNDKRYCEVSNNQGVDHLFKFNFEETSSSYYSQMSVNLVNL